MDNVKQTGVFETIADFKPDEFIDFRRLAAIFMRMSDKGVPR